VTLEKLGLAHDVRRPRPDEGAQPIPDLILEMERQ